MRLLVLASAHPSFRNGTAVNQVLAALLQALGTLGHETWWATIGCEDARDTDTEAQLSHVGATSIGDFSNWIRPRRLRPPFSSMDALRRAYVPLPTDDISVFRSPRELGRKLRAVGAEGFILFWDSLFEFLIDELPAGSVVLYGARPRHAAPLSRLAVAEPVRGFRDRTRVRLQKWLLEHQAARHYRRLRKLAGHVNVCAVDAADYRRRGIPCSYLSNTAIDVFGERWMQARGAAESERPRFGLLGNISGVNQTGNLFGLRYLAHQVLPELDRTLDGLDFEVNVTGGGTLPCDLARALDRPDVNIKGFIPDLEHEILANPVFLLLNNAGPYTGGYTRVIYAISSGACLIAHRRLADSMPEIVHEKNALLGGSPKEIAEQVHRAMVDGSLRAALGQAGRQTYEEIYRPDHVARCLVSLMETAA